MRIEGDKLIFSTGKRVYANQGIVGLAPGDEVTGGYDAGIWSPDEFRGMKETLTFVERIELARYMILRWENFKDSAILDLEDSKKK